MQRCSEAGGVAKRIGFDRHRGLDVGPAKRSLNRWPYGSVARDLAQRAYRTHIGNGVKVCALLMLDRAGLWVFFVVVQRFSEVEVELRSQQHADNRGVDSNP